MRPIRAFFAALAVTTLLAACGSGDVESDSSADDGATPTATTAAETGVRVSGEVGDKPSVEVPEGEPPADLATEVLVEGDGEAVEGGDLLVAHYLGQTWEAGDDGQPNVFDNSYDRGQPAGFGIGVGQVIQGWDQGLVGQAVGSRVLLVVPPELGYGEQGQPEAGIGGDDTLVFVVDIVDTFPGDLTASGEPTGEELPAGISIPDPAGAQPQVEVADDAQAPRQPTSTLVLAGDGPALEADQTLVAQVVQVDYATGQTVFSTADGAPIALQPGQVPGLAEALEGQQVGSRVLLTVPGSTGAEQGQGAAAIVVDVVGAF